MRVLHVINGLGTGGAERSLAEMLPLMRQAGVESVVACLARKPEGVHASVEQAGFPVHVMGASRVGALRRLRALVAATSPDLVHTTIYEADVLGRLAAVGMPVKVLSSLVNTTYDGVRVADEGISSAKLRMAQTLDAATARHMTDHFHAITAAVRDSAVTHLGIDPRRVTIVERGRSLDRLGGPGMDRRRKIRRALGVAEDAEVVLNIGRQEPQKGQATLLEAIAQVAAARPDVVLLQAGRRGRSTPALNRVVSALALEGRVHFLGHRDDVGDLLAAADVFAFPSVYEGLGGSVLEAMAMGTPAVVTDIPALRDVVEAGRGALMVPVGDSSALAHSLEMLLVDSFLARGLSERAREIFGRRFVLERTVERMVRMYEHVTRDRAVPVTGHAAAGPGRSVGEERTATEAAWHTRGAKRG